MEVFKEDIMEIAFRLRGEIEELSERLGKYKEKVENEIEAKQTFIKTLEGAAEKLPEKQPRLFQPEGVGFPPQEGGKTEEV